MRIPRIYVDLPLAENQTFDLPDPAFQHVCKVLRCKENHPVMVFNGTGGEYTATLCQVEKRQAKIHTTAYHALQNESPIKVTLGQVISRGERMDYAIQKAVEAGVHQIQPLFSERCEVKLNKERLHKRQQHWQQIAISAAEQSGRGVISQVLPAMMLSDWLPSRPESLKLTLHPHAAQPISDLSYVSGDIAVLIGPEGGLTEKEVQDSMQHQFQNIVLGPRVVRTETAPVMALTAINLLWGDIK
ncbi:16S rRNA (uracil(1498)-N(3))-methyltransferase [Marinomonas agarivorans]|nr:16S rRNA (uracil(1498)-N(3))-methyltransferase [Marinomonas agarivorans]